jgi:uncharacterized protein (TIGR00645 family)
MDQIRYAMPRLIFWSRWLQAPLYLGLIVVLFVYIYEFAIGLIDFVSSANKLSEVETMLLALNLIDVVMIANLLVMVIVGGYEIFVARLDIKDHPDHPEWLDEVNAGTMKVKLALALITISSIHLLSTFIDPAKQSQSSVMWQVIIHITLVFSAVMIAFCNRLMTASTRKMTNHNHKWS